MSAPIKPLLEMRAVSRVHADGTAQVVALHEVDLSVMAGEMVAVMGPSGSGKSTLLNLAGALDTATGGEVLLDGTAVANLSASQRAALRRRSVGYVFQDSNLIPALTAIENVMLPGELDGISTKMARAQALAALEEIDIVELADRFPAELSGGQRQRVAIARALVGTRALVLADEPTGALDSATGDAVMRTLRDRVDAGAAALVVTHEPRFASWADRIVFLRDGRVVESTQPLDDASGLLGLGTH